MSKKNNLAGQTLIYGLSSILPRVINYILAPYLTYLVFNKEEYGMMNYLYAMIPFVFTILLLGMESAYFRFVGKSEDNKEKYQDIFNTVWTTSLIGATIFLVATLLFKNSIVDLLDASFNANIIPIIGGIVAFDVACAIPFARVREQQKAMRFVWLRTISVVTNVFFVIFFYSILPNIKDVDLFSWLWIEDFGIGYVFVANLISSGLTFILLQPIYAGAKLTINLATLKSILVFSFPLFIGGFVGTATELIDRQLIESLLPSDIAFSELGIYTATLKITALMSIFTQMYRYAAEPFFLSNMKSEDFRKQNAEATLFFSIVSMVIFLVITLYIDIFQYVISPEFRDGLYIIPPLLVAGGLMGVYLNLSFWYKFIEKTHFAVIISIIGLTVIIVLNLILIPRIGYAGAAWAKLCGTAAMVGFSYIFNQLYYPTPYRVKRIVEYLVITAIIYWTAQLVEVDYTIINFTVRAILIAAFIIYAFKRERLDIKTLLKR